MYRAAKACADTRQRFTKAVACGDCLALLGLAARRGTRCALRATLKQPRQASQRARFARGRKPCAAQRFRGALPGVRARLCREIVGAPPVESKPPGFAAGGARRGRSLWRRGAQIRGWRALARFVSDSPRLLERSAQRVASSAAQPRIEHRSAVEAKRRPPQCEPPPATACREASERRKSSK